MVEVGDQDYRPLESFRLYRRWTDVPGSMMSPDVLANIRPLMPARARQVHDQTAVFHPDRGFDPGSYRLVDQIETEHEDARRVRDWLERHTPDLAEPVIASWSRDEAVVTTAAIFCDYWDDFCYPASDDVVITPLSLGWMLVYWHEEVFFFGRRDKVQS